ncbi:Bug family tripartite tricarboxylate transporter substrate binding protein [Oceanobacillus neutriphilus]|uniref:ABC transporter substrate-binding protein n=1 Tax=Oceanobacillus neutriphilus TaxID=531815 RepID=A0ABQ2NQ81_9BACI|nr:tripartite tricarboxylate transporter substrate binding protein [Oceanobacillus neutriphilus]GGP07866.1 ABC transporter substrate-binding protein [Oceanobacillus neutriphilus]
MKLISKYSIIFIAVFLLLTACSNENGKAEESNFPEKDITLIVPFGPGGAVDTISRMIAQNADEYMNGQNIVVENREGGGAVIGQTFVANAEPDGYTLLAFTSSVVSNPLTTDTSYTHEDFAPIALYSFEPELLVVPGESELESYEKVADQAVNGKINLVTPGHSTSHHSAGILLNENHGWNLEFVHTESAGEQIQQLLGGHVDAALVTYAEVASQIEEGTIRPIAIMDEERSEELPDTPTFQEEGIDLVYGPFRGLAAPADTPEETMAELEEIFTNIINDKGFIEDMESYGFEVVPGDAAELNSRIETEEEFIQQVLPFLE